MALVKNTIKNEIAAAFTQVINDESEDREDTIYRVADKLADAVMNAIKSAAIVYENGLIAPNGAVTGTFNGELE